MQHLARPKKELCDCGRAGDEWQSMGRKIGGYAHEDRGGRADGAGEGGRRRRCWRGRARLCRTWVDDLVDGGRLGEGKFLFVGVGEDGPGGGGRESVLGGRGGGGRWYRCYQQGKAGPRWRTSLRPFDEDDELGDAHLEVGSCDETCPDDGHDIPGSGLAVSCEFGAEPESRPL